MTSRAMTSNVSTEGTALRRGGAVRRIVCLIASALVFGACDSKRLCDEGACDDLSRNESSGATTQVDAALAPTEHSSDGFVPSTAETSPSGDTGAALACSPAEPCPDGALCHPELEVCVSCYANAHCSAPRAFCLLMQDPRDNACVGCLRDDDCGDLSCFGGVCARCDVATSDGCSAPQERCVEGLEGPVCVECARSEDCTNPERPACDVGTGTCVACLQDGSGCAEGQRCFVPPLASTGSSPDASEPDASEGPEPRCVECTPDTARRDCGADRPFCIDERCVECDPVSGSGCDRSARPFCRTGEELAAELDDPEPLLVGGRLPLALCVACETDENCTGTNGFCIAGGCSECRRDSDCSDPAASMCDAISHQCVPCSTSAQCSHIEGAKVCHVGDSQTPSGGGTRCVECDALDFRACDNAKNACNTASGDDQFTCSSTPVNTSGRCSECQSDAACNIGQRCVERLSDGGAVERRCLYFAGPDGACSNSSVAPFILPIDATSVDGVSGTYCSLATTTCDVFARFKEVCTDDDSCGNPQEGAHCFARGSDRRCSYRCAGNADCPDPARCTDGFCSPF